MRPVTTAPVDDGLTVNIEKDGQAVIAERLIGRSDSSFQNVTVNGATVLNVGGTLSVGGVLSGFDSILVRGNLTVSGELKGFDEIRVSGAVMEVGSLIFDGSGDSLNLAVSDPVAPGMEFRRTPEARRDAIQNIADNYAVLKLDRLDNSAGGTIIVTFDGDLADVEWVRIRVIDYTGSPDAAVDYGDFRFAGSHGVLAVSDNDLYLVVEGVREHVVVASNYATISDAMIAIKDMPYQAGVVEQPALISVETGRHVLKADDVTKNCRISGEGEEGAVLTAAGSLYLGSHWVTLDHLAVEFSGESNLYGGSLWEDAAYSAAGHDIASDVVLDSVVFTNLRQVFGGGAVTGKSMADFTGNLALTVSGATSAGQVYAGFEIDTSRMVYHTGETVLTLNTTGSVTSVRGGVVRNGTLEVEGSSRIAILSAGSGKVSVIGDYVAYSSATGAATVKRTGDTSVTIDAPGSVFGTVSGAGASFGGYYQLVGNSAVEIRGGSFTGDIYGGAMATSFGYAAQTHILGNTSVSIDCGSSLVKIGDLNIYACSYGKGSVSGDATVTFSGDGNQSGFFRICGRGLLRGDDHDQLCGGEFFAGVRPFLREFRCRQHRGIRPHRHLRQQCPVDRDGAESERCNGLGVRTRRSLPGIADGRPVRRKRLFRGHDQAHLRGRGDFRLRLDGDRCRGRRLVHESGGCLRMVQRRRGRVEGGRLVRRRIQAFRRGR